jgi:hypothetical protein
MLISRPMRSTTLTPLLSLARTQLLIESGHESDAAEILASLMMAAPEDDALASCLARLEGSDATLQKLTERLAEYRRERGRDDALANRLQLLGNAACEAGDHLKAAVALECYRAVACPDRATDEHVLQMLLTCASALRDFAKRRRHLGAWLAYRRLPIAAEPAQTASIEVDARFDSPDHAAAILAAHGMVVIRRLIDATHFPALVESFEAANPTEIIALRLDGTPMMPLASALVPDFLTCLLRSLMRREPELLPAFSFMRGLKLGQHRMVPFHQDINNFGAEMINCWVPLTPCLDNAPRLEVVAARLDELVETEMDTGDFKWIEEKLVRDRFPAATIVAPAVDLGDAILLLGTTIHRSFATEETVQKRFSIELRFAAASAD